MRLAYFSVLAVVATALQSAAVAAQIPPDARWRTFRTEHFRVTYVVGLEETARRAAERAEHAYELLSAELVDPPEGRIELVVADNVDFANGYATPIPTNRVVVYAHPPVNVPELAFYDDWLGLVILHELVHIFHLDTAGGIWERLRDVFGRNPLLFPEFFAPGWVLEGLATYYESRLTGAGRVRGSLHEMILRTAILEEGFFSIDRATGDPVLWPAGNTRYIYGSLFFQFLAQRYGPEHVPEFIRLMGRRLVPYRLEAAARGAFGASFSRAWQAWRDSLEARYAALADSLRAQGLTEPELLTAHGRIAAYPRYAPDGTRIAYTAATGRDEPSTRLIEPDGTVREVTDRNTFGPAAWFPDGARLLFADHQFVDPYRIYADLYQARLGGGDSRLTRAARVWEPDLAPDGTRAVVVQNEQGSNALALYDLASGAIRRLTGPSLDVHWSVPRWSPDGTRIAASRWSPGGLYDIVLLDTTGAVIRELTRDRAIDVAPAWSPDGRFVVFSSDRTGIPNLFAHDLRSDRLLQVTNVLSGALQPDVSPDGRWITFSYYRADGYHIARIPFAPHAWRPAPEPRPTLAEPLPATGFDGIAAAPARSYSPFPSVLPSAWSLLLDGSTELGFGAGAAIFGRDVVERHLWSAQLLAYPGGGRVEGGAVYRYRGLGNPVLSAVLAQDWDVTQAAGTFRGDPLFPAILNRDREAALGLHLLRPRWRSVAWLEIGGTLSDRHFEPAEPVDTLRFLDPPLDAALALRAGYSSARGYAFSVGPQDGITLAGTLEGHRYLEPFRDQAEPTGYLRALGRGRAFQDLALPGFARHVLALRVDAGLENGSRSPGFSAGGASGGAAPVPVGLDILGGGLAFPIRGYPEGAQRGNLALSASGEYRFPLLLVERGIGLLPLYLRRIWGDAFVDAGAAWCGGECESLLPDPTLAFEPLYSVGAELNLDFRLGYAVDLPLRVGLGLPLSEPYAGDAELYVRVGRSF